MFGPIKISFTLLLSYCSARSCICELDVSILPLSTIFLLELSRQCGIVCFLFHLVALQNNNKNVDVWEEFEDTKGR